jgi:hypothetical protein
MIRGIAVSLLSVSWLAFQPCPAATSSDITVGAGALTEVWTVDGLPRDVQVILGRFKEGPDGFADRDEPMNFTDVVNPKVASRRLVLAGKNESFVLVCFEYASGGLVGVASYRRSGGAWRQDKVVPIAMPLPRSLLELVSRLSKPVQ